MQFLDRLPQEADSSVKYTILAPDRGYGASVEMLMTRETNSIDVLVQRDDTRFLIRINPVPDQIIADPRRQGVYTFLGSVGQFLDYDGRETGRFISVFVYINTSVDLDGMPAGELRMWNQLTLNAS